MIYKDRSASGDCEEIPYPRIISLRGINLDEPCFNCGKIIDDHVGWRCPTSATVCTKFSQLAPGERYLTNSMKDSIPRDTLTSEYGKVSWPDYSDRGSASVKQAEKQLDVIPEWKKWARVGPGECACKIPKATCDYHKGS